MISLSTEKLAKAKVEAKELLEYAIFVTAATLAVDLEAVDGEYQNPFTEGESGDNSLFWAHESLRLQIQAFNSIAS